MRLLIIISLTCLLVTCAQNPARCQINQWQAGIAKAVITPQTPVWLAGYGTARPPDGKIHDLWVKVLALKDPAGKRVVMATTDHMGMSKTIYESLCAGESVNGSGSNAPSSCSPSHITTAAPCSRTIWWTTTRWTMNNGGWWTSTPSGWRPRSSRRWARR